MKPTLDLYIGHYVARIERGELLWQWKIVFDNGMEIRNKSVNETFSPNFEQIIGSRLQTITMSLRDTTLHFSNGEKWSLNPTQYAIYDPAYEGEAYPQWPEELEEQGIPSVPDGEISAQPGPGWRKRIGELQAEREARIMSNAQEFLKEEE